MQVDPKGETRLELLFRDLFPASMMPLPRDSVVLMISTEYSMVPSPFDKKYEYECKSCTRSKPTLRHLPKSW